MTMDKFEDFSPSGRVGPAKLFSISPPEGDPAGRP